MILNHCGLWQVKNKPCTESRYPAQLIYGATVVEVVVVVFPANYLWHGRPLGFPFFNRLRRRSAALQLHWEGCKDCLGKRRRKVLATATST